MRVWHEYMIMIGLAAVLPIGQAAEGYTDGDTGTAGLGVMTGPVPLPVQAVNGLSPGEGTMVRRVVPWAPAGQIGLQPGDVITSIDGVSTDSRRDLRAEIWSNDPGEAFQLTVLRDGQEMTLQGNYGRIPDFIEERLRLPSEDREAAVAARQRDILAAIDAALAAAEAGLPAPAAAAEDIAQLDALLGQGLPPLGFGPGPHRRVLGLQGSSQPWQIRYRWRLDADALPERREIDL